MDKFIILADVTCDLTEEMREYFGVQDYIPGHINLGNGREEITRLEWDYIEAKEFYKMLGSKDNKISTAPPNLEEYYNKFVAYVKEGYFSANWNTKPDGTGAPYSYNCQVTIEKNIVLYAQWKKNTGTKNGYEWVDLGLSVKWATMNIGASKPEENGLYFAWGEVEPKDYYSWGTYKYCSGSEYTITKYCTDSYWGNVDNKTILDPSDDAATVNWGGDWRMPTKEEINELLTKCTFTKTGNYIDSPIKIIGKNGNSIILPLSGSYSEDYLSLGQGHGLYWSSSGYNSSGSHISINFDKLSLYSISRYVGLPIRPVCP